MTFAPSGQLVASHPAARDCPVRLRVDRYAQPDELVVLFLRRHRSLILKQGVELEVSLNQQDIPL